MEAKMEVERKVGLDTEDVSSAQQGQMKTKKIHSNNKQNKQKTNEQHLLVETEKKLDLIQKMNVMAS